MDEGYMGGVHHSFGHGTMHDESHEEEHEECEEHVEEREEDPLGDDGDHGHYGMMG